MFKFVVIITFSSFNGLFGLEDRFEGVELRLFGLEDGFEGVDLK